MALRRRTSTWLARAGAIALAATAAAQPALGQNAPAGTAARRQAIDIPAQNLGSALSEFARQTRRQLLYTPDLVAGRHSQAVRGNMTPEQALAILLSGSGLGFRATPSGAFLLEPQAVQSDAGGVTDSESASAPILVVGSRIRGATAISPTVTISQAEIRERGYHELGELVRSLPQNFNGGQNPGIQFGAGGVNNQNVSSGSAVNLRGLGADATLTLLNGRRLSYDSFTQAVDISAIPVAAVDHIDVLLDGASAIYGSDAVGGVVNVQLRRDYDGAAADFRFGTTTDGGGDQFQASGVFGRTWNGGGAMVAVNFEHDQAILATQRDYLSYLPAPYAIMPEITTQNLLLTGHQELARGVELDLDALYTARDAFRATSIGALDRLRTHTEMWVISPTLRVDIGPWLASLNGSVARDRTDSAERQYAGGVLASTSIACNCNTAQSAELDGEGPLFALPGGSARASVGVGWRRNTLALGPTDARRTSYYAFGEINLPFVSPAQDVPAVYRLTLNGAVRAEDYSDQDAITTPKIALLWGPTADFDVRATWGRSFKTPTLNQENSRRVLIIAPAALLGAVNPPPGATAWFLQGGSMDLAPERAESYTLGLSIHPRPIPGLKVDVSYFHIDYRDRVVQPFPNTVVLNNPLYSDFIITNPSAALLQSVFDDAAAVLDLSGLGFDPSTVIALADGRYVNVTRQRISGVDAALRYTTALAGGRLSASADASWLKLDQQNLTASPETELSGTINNPPTFRGRGGLVWTRNGLTLGGAVNYLGGVRDTHQTPPVPGDSMTTVDMTLIYAPSAILGLHGVELSLSVLNLFNEAPPNLAPIAPIVVSYDSTNYSAVGRFVTASIGFRF